MFARFFEAPRDSEFHPHSQAGRCSQLDCLAVVSQSLLVVGLSGFGRVSSRHTIKILVRKLQIDGNQLILTVARQQTLSLFLIDLSSVQIITAAHFNIGSAESGTAHPAAVGVVLFDLFDRHASDDVSTQGRLRRVHERQTGRLRQGPIRRVLVEQIQGDDGCLQRDALRRGETACLGKTVLIQPGRLESRLERRT